MLPLEKQVRKKSSSWQQIQPIEKQENSSKLAIVKQVKSYTVTVIAIGLDYVKVVDFTNERSLIADKADIRQNFIVSKNWQN